MASGVKDVTGEIFSTRSVLSGKRLTVQLSGCLDMETAPSLQEFLRTLTIARRTDLLREFEFDTADLYMMSSSSISHLASWIKGLKGASPGCQVKFKTNPNLAWQRRTLDPIRRVAEELVFVE
jgi:hypothetical protein